MSDRERQAREAFEELLRGFLAVPEEWYGRLVLNVAPDGQVNPTMELGLPKDRKRVA